MPPLRTEFPFVLPKGLHDADGGLQRIGTMRLATARDELEPLRDAAVSGPDDPQLTLVVLARVITGLGERDEVTPDDLGALYAADLAHLQDVYRVVNYGTAEELARYLSSVQDGGAPDTATPAPLTLASPSDEVVPVPPTPEPALTAAQASDDAAPDGAHDHESTWATTPAVSPTPVSDAARVLLAAPAPSVPASDQPLAPARPAAMPAAAATGAAAPDPAHTTPTAPTPDPAAATPAAATPDPAHATPDPAHATPDPAHAAPAEPGPPDTDAGLAASTTPAHHRVPAASRSRRGRIEEVGRSTGRPEGR